jgi:hypothetical protein
MGRSAASSDARDGKRNGGAFADPPSQTLSFKFIPRNGRFLEALWTHRQNRTRFPCEVRFDGQK